jgi:AcrR family transcriptional regulator
VIDGDARFCDDLGRPTESEGSHGVPAPHETRDRILEAARRCVLAEGYAATSTRKVASEAGVPLSQVHYHFASKGGLMLALLEAEDRRRLARQTAMYGDDVPLWQRYEQACDFLEDDLESGYVRVLQEMIAAGWSTPPIAAKVREMQQGWFDLLTDVAEEAGERLGALGPFTPREVATLVGCAFIGGEAELLLGFDRRHMPVRAALRRVGQLIRDLEERDA